MWVLLVIVGLVIAAVAMSRVLSRNPNEALERHARALEALRDLADRPRPIPHDTDARPPDEHIRVLGDDREQPAEPPVVAPVADVAPPRDRRWPRRVAIASATAGLVVAVAGVGMAVTRNRGSGSGTARTPETTATVAPTTTPPTVPPTTRPRPVVRVTPLPAGGATVSGVGTSFALVVRANGTSWIQISGPAGTPVSQRVLQAGDVEQQRVSPPLALAIGNTPAVTVSVDGTPLDLSAVGGTTTLHFAS